MTKRRYTGGWHISKLSSAKKASVGNENCAILPKENRFETPEIVKLIKEKKLPEDTDKTVVRSFSSEKGRAKRIVKNNFKIGHAAVNVETDKSFNNKTYLVAEYTTFGLSLGSAGLGYATLSSFATLATVFFAAAIILFLVSVILSLIALYKIRKLDLDHKLWPHKIIIGSTLTIFCLALSLVVALIAALVTENVFIIIAAGVITFLLLMSKAFSKL